VERSNSSQILFSWQRLWKTLTRASNILATATLVLAQPFLWAQTAGTFSGVAKDQTGSALADSPVKTDDVDTTATKTGTGGLYKSTPLSPGDYRVRFVATDFYPTHIMWANRDLTVTADPQAAPAQPQTGEPAAAASTTPDSLTWHGITLYGAYDIGVGWVSHGLPENGYNYEGAALVNRNGYQHRFLVAPNNLQQTGFGVRGKIEFSPGWFVVFNASTGINPQSGLLANASKTDIINNGLPRASYSYAIDGSRAGQPLNDEYYGGISNEKFGTLTFGRQRSLGTDVMLLYDPAAGAYAFSYIGYNGTMAGGGDTEDTRWDSAVKYKIAYGRAHLAAMYKFADGNGGCFSASATWTAANCTPETTHNNAFGVDVGATYHKFSADLVYQLYNQAISVLNPLLGPQSLAAPYQSTTNSVNEHPITGANLISPDNTVYGIVTDNNAFMAAGRYAWERFKLYGGFEYIWQNNPHNPLGVGASDQGGYLMSGVENNNLDTEKILRVWWTGVKYTYNTKTDFTFAWYGQLQNDFRSPQLCSAAAGFRASCSGGLDEGSLFADHRFVKRFDGFVGLAYSFVYGGAAIAIPHGPGVPYLHNSNFAPTIGARFSF
jgi:predicted porin